LLSDVVLRVDLTMVTERWSFGVFHSIK
jgi:hypothetical protein